MRYKVSDIIKHEDYFMPVYAKPDITNDIALIRLEMPIQFNELVQPIKYSIEEVEAGETLQVTGWGRLSVGNMMVDIL